MITKNLGTITAPGITEQVVVSSEDTNVAVQYVATGDLTGVTATFEGSLDGGTTWGVLETHTFSAGDITALGKFVYIVDKPVPLFRINISTLTFTTAGTLTTLVRFDK